MDQFNQNKIKVLVVEDNPDLNDLLRDTLVTRGFQVTTVDTAEKGLDILSTEEFRLIILDWELPGKSGLELCAAARTQGVSSSILFLTARSDIDDRLSGLDTGGDDYLTKPFEMREMLARISALLRRAPTPPRTVLRHGAIELDKERNSVSVNGSPVSFTTQEIAILDLLLSQPSRVFSIDEIIRQAWQTDSEGSNQAVRSAIMRIRTKLNPDDDNPVIVSIKGVGYKFGP